MYCRFLCRCGAFPTSGKAKDELEAAINAYQQSSAELINSGRYDGRDDFTIVVQPFFEKTFLPVKVHQCYIFNDTINTGQLRSECLTCTFRTSCCSARMSRVQVATFAGSSVRNRKVINTSLLMVILALQIL